MEPVESHWQLQLELRDRGTDKRLQASWNWTSGNAQQTLFAIEEQLNRWLATETAALPRPPHFNELIAPENFQRYLEALAGDELAQSYTDHERSIKQLNEVLAQDPTFTPALMERCRIALYLATNTGAPDAIAISRADCPRLTELTPNHERAWTLYGRHLLQEGQLDEAIAALETAARIDPRYIDAYLALADAYDRKGRPIDAEHALQRAIALNPGHWRSLRALARFQYEHARYPDAIQTYQKVAKLLPNNAGALNDVGAAQLMSGALQDAATSFTRALQLDEDPDTLSNLGIVYYHLGRFEEAARHNERAVALLPHKPELWGNWGDALRHAGHAEAARQKYREALRLLPEAMRAADPGLQAMSAFYQYFSGDEMEAEKALASALARTGNNAQVYYYQSVFLLQKGDKTGAIAALQRAMGLGYASRLLTVDPDLAPLANEAAFLHLLSASAL
jgi:tetratricopeptide (TPR) repeat protein